MQIVLSNSTNQWDYWSTADALWNLAQKTYKGISVTKVTPKPSPTRPLSADDQLAEEEMGIIQLPQSRVCRFLHHHRPVSSDTQPRPHPHQQHRHHHHLFELKQSSGLKENLKPTLSLLLFVCWWFCVSRSCDWWFNIFVGGWVSPTLSQITKAGWLSVTPRSFSQTQAAADWDSQRLKIVQFIHIHMS